MISLGLGSQAHRERRNGKRREFRKMSVHDAEPNDVYVDEDGKLWRVLGTCGEPTVIVQEVEPLAPDSPVKLSGGVSGLMWRGWKRIHRQPKPVPPSEQFSRRSDWHYDSQGYCDNPGRGY